MSRAVHLLFKLRELTNHTDDGTHEFLHIHIWDWTKKPPRQDSRR